MPEIAKSLKVPSGKSRLATLALVTALAGLLFAAHSAFASSSLVIYKNSLKSKESRSNVAQFDSRAKCSRSGSKTTLRTKVGKKTKECAYRVPVVGKSVELSATGRLFKSTPKAIRGQTFLGLSIRRAANGSSYQLVVFPSSTRAQIRKVESNGRFRVLAGAKLGRKRVNPLGKANRMSFGAYNGTKGKPASNARLFARVNGKRVLLVDDPKGNELSGTGMAFAVGSDKNARNAAGSFSGVAVRMPDPFG